MLVVHQCINKIEQILVVVNQLPVYHILLQVINNACATQAILSILLNCQHSDMDLGTILTEFKDFSQSFDPTVSLFPKGFKLFF